MKTMVKPTLNIIVALLFSGNLWSSCPQEKKITQRELPEPVRAAFQQSYPHAAIRGLSREVEGDKTFYEIESVDGTTRRDLLYSKDGKIHEVEETIPATELPKSVHETLRREFTTYTLRKVERSSQDGTLHFEVQLVAGEHLYEVTVAPDGQLSSKKELRIKKAKKPEGGKKHEDDD